MKQKEFYEGRKRKNPMSGIEHLVFNSTDGKTVFKMASKTTIDEWYDTFKSNPDLFPKIIKRDKRRVKLTKSFNYQKRDRTYVLLPKGNIVRLDCVELEKLDTERVNEEWNKLDAVFELAFQSLIPEFSDPDFMEFMASYIVYGYEDSALEKILLKVKEINPNIYNLTMKYLDIVDKAKKYKTNPDLHQFNFGYNKEGKLKCLDI